MSRRRKRGFTLPELLTVVAILGLLAAILLPVFAQVRDAARRTTCLANLKQLALGHRMYVQEYDDALPSFYLPTPERFVYIMWPEFLRPYYRDARLLDQGFTRPRESNWLADYALCAWGPDGLGTRDRPYYRWPGALYLEGGRPRPMRLAEVRRPAEVLQFADGSTVRYETNVFSRHTGGILNGAYVDGHVGRVSEAVYNHVDQDERGYFYTIAAADR